MPTSAGTSPTEVRVEIDTYLDDPDVNDILDRIEREIDRAYDGTGTSFSSTQHRMDFEAALAALRIAEGRDRRAESTSSRSSRTGYETDEIDNLRKRVRRTDPGAEFGRSGRVVRDDNRHTTSTVDD